MAGRGRAEKTMILEVGKVYSQCPSWITMPRSTPHHGVERWENGAWNDTVIGVKEDSSRRRRPAAPLRAVKSGGRTRVTPGRDTSRKPADERARRAQGSSSRPTRDSGKRRTSQTSRGTQTSRSTSTRGNATTRHAQGSSSRSTRSNATTRRSPPERGSSATRRSVPDRRADNVSKRRRQNQQSKPGTPQRKRPLTQKQKAARAAALRREQARRAAVRRKRLRIIGWVLLAIAAVVATFVVVNYSLRKIDEHTTASDPAVVFEPVECTAEMLDVQLIQSGMTAGGDVTVGVELKNNDPTVPCYLNPDANKLRFEITSGEQVIFDSTACDMAPITQRLLLSPGLKTTPSVVWNGNNYGPRCLGTATAEPGMYVFRAYFDGEPLTEQGKIFELFAPPPEPVEGEEETEPAEETATEETTEEAPVEETPAEEVPAEDAPVEEVPTG